MWYAKLWVAGSNPAEDTIFSLDFLALLLHIISMSDPRIHLKQSVSPQNAIRTVLVGRVKMAQAIQLPESQWARLIGDIERDPLFQDLLSGKSEGKKVIRFKRFGQTKLASQFYDNQETNVAGGHGSAPETILNQKIHLLKLIQKIGQDNFEKFFLYREEGESLENIAEVCHLSMSETKEIQDLILDVSVQAEFYHPSALESNDLARPQMVGKIIPNVDGTYSMSFFSPHLARGMYEIDRDALKRWQKNKGLNRSEAARLRKYIGVLELSNMKQGAFWQVTDFILKAQKAYFDSKDETKLSPISLRKGAKDLHFSPSTLSRVLALKSVLLPWDKEVLITDLMPGQRRVVLVALDKTLHENNQKWTDLQLAHHLAENYSLHVSRRTITACRHLILKENSKNP
ncbi:MAG: hypothetical protein ACKVQC_06810 [Elusimicrobiota bacterium]